MTDRRPPAAEEAERALIGCVLIDPKLFTGLTAILSVEDFFSPMNGEIWEVMVSLHQRKRAIDTLTVIDEIKTRGLKRIEPDYLTGCGNDVSFLMNAEQYARLVREKAVLRRLIATSAEVMGQAYGDVGDTSEFIHDSVVKISRAATMDGIVHTESLADTTDRVIQTMERAERGEITPRLATGIAELDRILDGGMRVGLMVVPIAQTSIGKSSWARQIIFRGAKERGTPGLLFSLEDSREDALTAGAANLARIDTRIFAPRGPTNLPPDNSARWRVMHGALSVVASLGDLIRIETYSHIGKIIATIAAWRAQTGRPGVVVVDQFSWVKGVRRKGETREQEVASVSRALKDAAKDLGVALIVPSQVTDEARREKKMIGFGQTRESRAIEQDADILIAIHRLRQRINEPCQLAVLKHRGGATGVCTVGWRGSWNGFESPTPDEQREMED